MDLNYKLQLSAQTKDECKKQISTRCFPHNNDDDDDDNNNNNNNNKKINKDH